MAITHDLYTTYDSSYLSEDIRGLATMIDARLTVSWDLIPEKEPGSSTDLSWYDAVRNSLDGTVRADWNNSDLTSLTISNTLATVVQIGDILRIEDEYVVITGGITRTSGSGVVSVYARGHGSSSAAAHLAGVAVKIVGNAQLEGTVEIAGMSMDTEKRTNFYQLVEEMVEVSKTGVNQEYKDIADKVDWEREGALRRALEKINRSVFYGIKAEGSKILPRTTGCLEEYINSTTYDSVRVNQAGAFTELGLQNMLKTIVLRGGAPKIILMSPKNKQVANGFNNSYVQTGRTDREAGIIIDQYQDENAGLVVFVSDPKMRDDVVFALNTDKLGKQWFANDTLRFEPETNVSSREYKETLQGQYAFTVKDAAYEHGVLYGVV